MPWCSLLKSRGSLEKVLEIHGFTSNVPEIHGFTGTRGTRPNAAPVLHFMLQGKTSGIFKFSGRPNIFFK